MAATLLLITKDVPTPDRRKAGLFPVTIRHHLMLGAKVILYCMTDDLGGDAATLTGFPGLEHLNAGMRPPGWLGRRSSRLSARDRERQIAAAAKWWNVDAVVGLQSAPQTGLLAGRIAAIAGVPCVSWEHLTSYGRGDDAALDDKKLKRFFLKAEAVAAVSARTLRAIEGRYGLSLPNAITIPNPVPDDFETATPPLTNRYSALTQGHFTFGGWTNWRDIKRLDILLDAYGVVAARFPNTKLILAGPIPPRMRQRVVDHPAAGKIVSLGNVSREDIRHLASAVDCCCVSSDHETFGLPVVEALAAGRPVISTDADGPSEILGGHPELGILVPKGDVAAFAEAMVSVAAGERTFDADVLRAHAIAQYGAQAQMERWRALYQSIGLAIDRN